MLFDLAVSVLRLSFLIRYARYTGFSIGGFLGCVYSSWISCCVKLLDLPFMASKFRNRTLNYYIDDLMRILHAEQDTCHHVHQRMIITSDLDWAQGLYFYELIESVFTVIHFLFELRQSQSQSREEAQERERRGKGGRSVPYFSILVILFSMYSSRDTWWGTSAAYTFEDYLKAPTLIRKGEEVICGLIFGGRKKQCPLHLEIPR